MPDNRYAGMTVNERLVVAGLLDDFEGAVRRWDKEAALAVLQQVEMSREEALETVDAIFANPAFYGFPPRK
jgi:hypothetical protein